MATLLDPQMRIVSGPQGLKVVESHVTTLTKRELAAVQEVLMSVGGLLTATDASEMLVTYPSQFREREAPTDIVALQEFDHGGNDEFERQECGGVDRPSKGADRRT